MSCQRIHRLSEWEYLCGRGPPIELWTWWRKHERNKLF